MELNVDVRVDDSKVHVIRGPISLRSIAIEIVKNHVETEERMKAAGIIVSIQHPSDAQQVLDWLTKMEI